jgi:hypothetical protein
MKFRIVVGRVGLSARLRIYAGEHAADSYCGDSFMPQGAALAYVDALLAGHVGREGSGADVEIVAEDPASRPPP